MNQRLDEICFSVLDIETTGTANIDEIVEIAVVRVEPNLCINMRDTFCTLINPERPIGAASFIHGITDNMVIDEPVISEVLPELMEFVQDTIIVAHNAPFDMRFINKALNKHSIEPLHKGVIDTVKIARKVYPNLEGKHGLDNLINKLNLCMDVDSSYRHRALFDAAHTAELLVKLIMELGKRGTHYMNEL